LWTPTDPFWNVAGNVTQPRFDGFTVLHQKRAAGRHRLVQRSGK
jgi:hypothetical protein